MLEFLHSGLFAVSSNILDLFKRSRKPITPIEQNVKKDCYFFCIFLLGLNLFTFVRVAEKMYRSPEKKV